jgi:hypothetical protein
VDIGNTPSDYLAATLVQFFIKIEQLLFLRGGALVQFSDKIECWQGERLCLSPWGGLEGA